MERVFVDTSAWVVLVNARDRHHGTVRQALASHDGRLVTSNYVFDETVTLCRARLGHAAASHLGDLLRDPRVVDLARLTEGDERQAWELFLERNDQEYSFTDCTSFVLMRRLGLDTVAALDHDFDREGFLRIPAGPVGAPPKRSS